MLMDFVSRTLPRVRRAAERGGLSATAERP
jgi:hypothetical protein